MIEICSTIPSCQREKTSSRSPSCEHRFLYLSPDSSPCSLPHNANLSYRCTASSKVSLTHSGTKTVNVYEGYRPEIASNPPSREQQQQRQGRRYEYFCLGSLCFCTFLSGWGDGSNGPLIPTMQRHYHVGIYSAVLPVLSHYVQINYTVVSMIFIPYAVVSIILVYYL